MGHAHEERLATIKMDAYLQAFQSIAPGVSVKIFGSGNQTSRIFNDLMSFSHGIQLLGDEVPLVERIIDGGKNGNFVQLRVLGQFLPYIQQVLADVNPRMFSSLKVADVVEKLEPVIAGNEDLASALTSLKDDANFRVVGDLPIKSLLSFFGLNVGSQNTTDDVILDVDEKPLPLVEEDELDDVPLAE
jgi:hypothetical protein